MYKYMMFVMNLLKYFGADTLKHELSF